MPENTHSSMLCGACNHAEHLGVWCPECGECYGKPIVLNVVRQFVDSGQRLMSLSHSEAISLVKFIDAGIQARLRLVRELEGVERDLRILGQIITDPEAAATVDRLLGAFGR